MSEYTSKRWKDSSAMYKYFAKNFGNLSFGKQAATDMYDYESTGEPVFQYYDKRYDGKCNGYAVGKHWMDVNLAMWREDLRSGMLVKHELLSDPTMPRKLKDVIRDFKQGTAVMINIKYET